MTLSGPAAVQTQDGLPRGWSWTTLGDVVELLRNGLSTAPREDSGVPILRISAVRPLRLDVSDLRYLPGDLADYEGYELDPGDLLFTRYNGNVGLVGVCAVVPEGTRGIVHPDKLIRVKLRALSPAFVAAAATVGQSREHIRKSTRSTAGQAGISGSDLKQTPIPVAPLDEQRRIVDALDSYLTRLDAATKGVNRAAANLKRYRASVLNAAVEGRLVPNEAGLASEQDRGYEPASDLLTRILRERRRLWEEAALAHMKAKGQRPKNDSWKERYEEPIPVASEKRAPIPEGWRWATIDQLSTLMQYGTSAKTNDSGHGVPVVRMGNIVDGALVVDPATLKYLPAHHDEFPALFLEAGDMIFNRTNSAELVGKSAVYAGQPPECSFASYLIRVRFADGVLPTYVAAFINSPAGKSWVASVKNQQVGQANVNGSKLASCAIPLPPLAEQQRIVLELDRAHSNIETLSAAAMRDGARIARLQRAILKWAFEGKLVDQDAKDEPADALLRRLRLAGADATEKTRPTRQPTRKTA